jgi:heat-inducible transcriptional repressor
MTAPAAADLGYRQARVLRAVVRDYIKTGEPIGSGTLAGRHRLGVSAATIRNDMALLEELGYLTHPHTSAGRLPTDLGYRFYVDTLGGLPRLSDSQREVIAASIDERVADVEDVMRRTAHVLSRMTHYAAVALSPTLERTRVVRADLVWLGPGALLLVVSDSGRVDKRMLDVPEGADADTVHRASEVTGSLRGLTYPEARARLLVRAREAGEPDRAILGAVAEAFHELEREPAREHVFIGGVGNIAREEIFEHRDTLRLLFDALDEEATILRFLRGLATDEEEITVRIGRENPLAAMREASVIVSWYRVGDRPVGSIAVIGPTRMEYPTAMSTVAEVARRLSNVIEALGG